MVDVQTIETGQVRGDTQSMQNIGHSVRTESLSDLASSKLDEPELTQVVQTTNKDKTGELAVKKHNSKKLGTEVVNSMRKDDLIIPANKDVEDESEEDANEVVDCTDDESMGEPHQDDDGEEDSEDEVIGYADKQQKSDDIKLHTSVSEEPVLVQVNGNVLQESIQYLCDKHNLSPDHCLGFGDIEGGED